ncbi:MAG: hypothetical protein Q7T20_02735 [Saprospiraceae bacterium]|nr:hypothetical protein [Saprospiraceae bacterium]
MNCFPVWLLWLPEPEGHVFGLFFKESCGGSRRYSNSPDAV